MKKYPSILLLFFIYSPLLFFCGCWESSNSAQVDALRYDPQNIANDRPSQQRWRLAYKVIADQCLACHLDYRTTNQESFVEMGLVLPGLPEHSPLYVSLKGAGISPETESMPVEGLLDASEIATIRSWILNLE